MRSSAVAAAVVLGALSTACSDDQPLPPAVLITTDPPPATAGSPPSTTQPVAGGVTDVTSAPVVISSTTVVEVGELDPKDVFADLSPYDASLSFLDLSDVDSQRLEDSLRSDQRVGPHLQGVEAKALMREGDLVAVALALAVDPQSASAPGFTETFLAGATSGGVADPLPLDVAGYEVTVWITGDTSSLVWVLENVYVVVTGRDAQALRTSVDSMVRAAVGLAPAQAADSAPGSADGGA